jgi:hypothetical protein
MDEKKVYKKISWNCPFNRDIGIAIISGGRTIIKQNQSGAQDHNEAL